MRIKESEAIVLRTFKLAEADKIIVCLTKNQGLVRGVAKGARRLQSKFGASLEPFTLIQFAFLEKEGRELVSVRHTEILRSYFNLAKRDETVAALEYLAELTIEFAPPNQPDEKVFRMVKACVAAVDDSPEMLHAFVRYFEIWILRLSGFLPDLGKCGQCGREVRAQRVHVTPEFSPRCEECSGRIDAAFNADVYALLKSSQTLSPKTWALSCVAHDAGVQRSLAHLAQSLIERHLERKPRGSATFFPPQVGARS